MNRPDAPDVLLAQAFLTASGGHPIQLHEQVPFAQGYYPGIAREQLRNRLYFTIDTEADLDAKWADILALRPDFVKLNLWDADEFAVRRDDPRFVGKRGLDPDLLPKIVARARQHRLRSSVHISSAADFHHAVAAGVDEIVHSASPSPFNTIRSAAQPDLFNDPAALGKLFIATLSGAGGTPQVGRRKRPDHRSKVLGCACRCSRGRETCCPARDRRQMRQALFGARPGATALSMPGAGRLNLPTALCQNCVRYPLKTRSNTIIYEAIPTLIGVARSR